MNDICNYFNKNQSCSPNSEYCSCIYTLEFNIGDVVEFVIVDQGFTFQSNHPMHLHGHSYAVLAVNKFNTSIRHAFLFLLSVWKVALNCILPFRIDDVIKMDKEGLIKRNLDRPPIKDTVTVPVGGLTVYVSMLIMLNGS